MSEQNHTATSTHFVPSGTNVQLEKLGEGLWGGGYCIFQTDTDQTDRHRLNNKTNKQTKKLTSSKVIDQLPFSTIGTKKIGKKKSNEIAHLLTHQGDGKNKNRHLLILIGDPLSLKGQML